MGWSYLPWWTSRGFGRLVTQVWGHMSTLAGWSEPSKNFLRVSDKWMPPRGVFGKWLGGTRARQYIPTWCILSTAWRTLDIHWKLCKRQKETLKNMTFAAFTSHQLFSAWGKNNRPNSLHFSLPCVSFPSCVVFSKSLNKALPSLQELHIPYVKQCYSSYMEQFFLFRKSISLMISKAYIHSKASLYSKVSLPPPPSSLAAAQLWRISSRLSARGERTQRCDLGK